jgi:hypothetical protein
MPNVNVKNYEELGVDSTRALELVDRLDTISEEYVQLKERLSGWQSEHKDGYIASLDETYNKIQDMIRVARSYGEVGLQTSNAVAETEQQIRNLNEKFANMIN